MVVLSLPLYYQYNLPSKNPFFTLIANDGFKEGYAK